MLETVGLAPFKQRYPHELSGGQQQRVALARALAPRPAVLLLDEPFSNLDADLRSQMLHEVYAMLRELGTTAVFVTHDHEEAFMVADRVGVLNRGKLEQLGRPEEIYYLPATRFVARFVGQANFIPGRVAGHTIETMLGLFPNVSGLPQGVTVELMIRPDQLDVRPDSAGTATVMSRRFRGADTLIVVQLSSGLMLHIHQSSALVLQPRERVRIVAQPAQVVAFLAAEA
jgi:iron(III) transport system ATP-binding protein